mmetsp:Transcript_91805/g.230654  ORF Transcript_91805/g.230654 Transcript_91805/m.230654 type:complete len:211 (-) Transcript_91805:46-678(-)
MEAGSAQVQQALASGEFNKLVTLCEDVELALQEELPDTPSAEQANHVGLLYAVHLLAYLLEGRLHAARFLWKRTPAAIQQHAQAAAAHGVLAARWRRQHAEVFQQLGGGAWEASLQPLVNEVISRSRDELLGQVGEAYKVIAVTAVAAMLGLDDGAVRQLCAQRGWAVDEAGFAHPTPAKRAEDLLEMGEDQLKRLAEYVSYLELPQCRI